MERARTSSRPARAPKRAVGMGAKQGKHAARGGASSQYAADPALPDTNAPSWGPAYGNSARSEGSSESPVHHGPPSNGSHHHHHSQYQQQTNGSHPAHEPP